MRKRSPISALTIFSIFFLLASVILLTLQLVRFSRLRATFPANLTIAGIPVGQLNRKQAADRLYQVYTLPIELHYGEAVIQLSPDVVGFQLDIEAMLAAADQERVRLQFWSAFWNYLWNRPTPAVNIPLRSSYSEERLRAFLSSEVATRYDQPPVPARPVVGTVLFEPGQAGTVLDIEQSIIPAEAALRSPSNRVAYLPLERTSPSRPAFQNLEVLLQQTIKVAGFDGVAGVYLLDLQTGQEINFTLNQGQPVSTPPDVVFSASSTIKIPIMISAFRRLGENIEPAVTTKLEEMIGKSLNPSTDWIMQNVIDNAQGPLVVTEDIHALGLENTFLAGYFYDGAPLLASYKTPGNQRPDGLTSPDRYNQTSPLEMGLLLGDVYECANLGGGALMAAFPGEITQTECQTMLNYLVMDKIALLIQAGVPDGTRVAHKHGWITDYLGIIHDMSDAAIVYTPGGDFVLAVYLYHPVQLVFDPSNELVSNLARAAYNFYNLPTNK